MSPLHWFLVCSLLFATIGCDSHDHGHDHSNSHDKSENGADPGHAHEGERQSLGDATIAERKVTVTQIGDIEPGHEAFFEVAVEPSTDITAVRVWIGDEAGTGAMKSKANRLESGAYDAHVELGKTIADGSRVWVEVELASGVRDRKSFAPHS